jgi:hypothetical protein
MRSSSKTNHSTSREVWALLVFFSVLEETVKGEHAWRKKIVRFE